MNLTTLQTKIQNALGKFNIEDIAKKCKFTLRKRKIAAHNLINALVLALGSGTTKTLADIHRHHNKLTNIEIEYKPFHNQIKKESFLEMNKEVAQNALNELTASSLPLIGILNRFKDVILHDGSSLTLHDDLSDVFPGRFTKTSPAAVELHVTMNLGKNIISRIKITPDTATERKHCMSLESLSECLVMMDAGYFEIAFMKKIDECGGYFMIRAPKHINPIVSWVGCEDGHSWRPRKDKKLTDILNRLPKNQTIDMDVYWKEQKYRLIAHWVKSEKKFSFVVTNLSDRKEYNFKEVSYLYRLRWQIELLFKEWKSNNGLIKFNTRNSNIVQSLIIASFISLLLKRIITCCASSKGKVLLSTFKASKSIFGDWYELMASIVQEKPSKMRRVLKSITDFLIKNAKVSNPKRDMKTGKLRYGINTDDYVNCHRATL